MRILQLLKSMIESVFGLLGVNAYLLRKKSKSDILLFDRNTLSAFYRDSKRVKLYYEGLNRANGEWTDNFSKQCRFYSLQEMVEVVLKKGLDGDFVECGCWKGHSTYIISTILSENNFKNIFHIFDSFEKGLSERTPEDADERFELSKQEVEKEKMMFGSTEEEVKRALSDFAFLKFYKGWIPERFKEVDNCKFSFVHIDVDLYQPTLKSLNFFYPRLVAGGCIVIDDYGFTRFPGSKKAVDAFLAGNEHSLFYEIPTGGCFIIK